MDRIFINNLIVRGKHGVREEEREKPQEFVLDIQANFDTRTAAASDDLSDTIDYDFFRNTAKHIVEEESFLLLERLADSVARKILSDIRIERVSVSVRKTEMYPDCTPGITVVRTRA